MDIYSVLFIPSGEILDISIYKLWGNSNSYEFDEYDIRWSNRFKMYVSKDRHLKKIYKQLGK